MDLSRPNGLRRWLRSGAISSCWLPDIRKAIAAGVPLSEAVKTAGQSERTNWALFDDFNERNATVAYAELEWE